jgi:DNA polymerase-3 subunit delta
VDLAIKFKEKDYYNLLKFLLEKELEMRNSEKNKEAIFWEVIAFLKLFNSF